MASQKVAMGIVLILVAMFWGGIDAQSRDCTNSIVSMSPCLNYVSGNSSSPSPGCCTQLGTIVRSQPECLCQVLNGGGSSLGLDINQTQALALPKACNVQTPPSSQCNAGSPSGSPDGGSKNVPSTGNNSSDATSSKLDAPLMFLLLFVASYVSTLTMS
ncbi:non-specific lipid-transfer protein-like protein At2g13820 [Olea europaea var. sylvestris]|uniref:Non-specific lipid-transfer At2g13820 n=1 Tax=Olea europaea subsp. europaea TaxID=158383 RepID=A0A8S0T3Q5_OLEEU|nr:non-specific lipid-transfer protein-like protein At2g13820 [Olea europaea var. sylvestris]CAA2998372.1 non-specific lipid-transfer At2g13820 [Olea europaea subsp. europaea]